jgi:hypothetical protein
VGAGDVRGRIHLVSSCLASASSMCLPHPHPHIDARHRHTQSHVNNGGPDAFFLLPLLLLPLPHNSAVQGMCILSARAAWPASLRQYRYLHTVVEHHLYRPRTLLTSLIPTDVGAKANLAGETRHPKDRAECRPQRYLTGTAGQLVAPWAYVYVSMYLCICMYRMYILYVLRMCMPVCMYARFYLSTTTTTTTSHRYIDKCQ